MTVNDLATRIRLSGQAHEPRAIQAHLAIARDSVLAFLSAPLCAATCQRRGHDTIVHRTPCASFVKPLVSRF